MHSPANHLADLPAQPAAGPLSRVIVSVVLVGTFALLAWADATAFLAAPPAWWLLPVALVLCLGGTDEMGRLFAAHGVVLPMRWLKLVTLAIPLAAAGGANAFPSLATGGGPATAIGWAATALMLAVGSLFVLEILRYRSQSGALERLGAGVLVLAFIGLPLAFVVSLRLLGSNPFREPGTLGILPLVSTVAVVKAGDIAAYLVGSAIGRHRMAPQLSPGKTWQGAAASLIASVATAGLLLGHLEFRLPLAWALFGLSVGMAGMGGDLAESLIKRETGAKDSGRSLGGLGGVLDLCDSLLFAAPMAWLFWNVAG